MTDPSEGRPGESARDPLIGARIDSRYEILRRLGRGGMSTVYAARHLLLHKEVAVKVLKEELAHDQRVIDMIFREARTVARLGHPSIVNALDVGITPEGLAYIVLELLEGVSLGLEIARCGRIDTARAVRIATQVASAMAAAHGAGVVHRDLKPENIFLLGNAGHKDTPDACKVLDFGVAKHTLAAMHGATLTSYGGVVGTPGYMAPEQLLTPDRVDHRVDVYALGVVLFEMLAGQPPYHDVQTLPELVVRVQQGGAPSLKQVAPSVPEALAEIVDMAMARSPDDRFQTMAEFGRGLRSYAVESGAFTDSPWLLAQGVTPPPVYIPHGFGTTPQPPAAPNPHGVTPSTLPALMVVPSSPVPLPVARREPTLSRGVTPSPSPSPMAISAGLPTPPQRIVVGQPTPSPLSVDGAAPTMLPPGIGGPTPSPLAVDVAPPVAPRRSWPLVVGVVAVLLAGAGIALRATLNTEMELSVTSTTPAAVATVRGSDYRLPAHVRLKRHADPEMVQVRAPGFQDKSLWVTLDKDLSLVADLTPAQVAPTVVEPTPASPAVAPPPPAAAAAPPPAAPTSTPVAAPPVAAAPSPTAAPAPTAAPSPASRPSTSTSRGDRTPTSTTRPTPSAPSATTPAPSPSPAVAAATPVPAAAPTPAPASVPPAPTTAPVVAAPVTPAPLSAAAITSQVTAHRAAVDACIAEDPSVGGHMVLRIAVRADGTVESASAESGATPAVRSCIVRQAKTWRFPAGSGRAEGKTSIDLD